jgi:outer membrane lipoprotein-sorting protein
MGIRRLRAARAIASVCILLLPCVPAPTQEHDPAAVIRRVDAAVAARFENILGFTDVEHYVVYRGDDQVHPAAEMTVRDTYKKGVGKTYTVISQSGSSILLHFGLKPLLENEQTINQPGNVEKSWFNSANYVMKLNSAAVQKLNGRDCFALDIKPKEVAPNLIIGTMWVDAQDGTLVQIDGVASKNPSAFSGTTHMMREYTNINGYSMAIHARAESDSALLGRTVVTIDYNNYNLEIKTGK